MMWSEIDDAGQAPLGARRAVTSIYRATWAPFPSSLEIVVEDRAEEPIEQHVAIVRIELGGGSGTSCFNCTWHSRPNRVHLASRCLSTIGSDWKELGASIGEKKWGNTKLARSQ